ncbi:MAG: chorismate mutase [Clostridia bacterium]|nr:chorismate mutase [Clostridia bacterium]
MDKLEELRNTIDSIDESIAKLLSERFSTAEKIGCLKKESGIEITDQTREKEVIENAKSAVADKYKDSTENVFKMIINESKNLQK